MNTKMQKTILYGKRVLSVLLFLACMLLLNQGFRYLLIDDTNSYTRIALHEMYEQENIDILFLGSSHCYRSIDPSIIDDAWGVNTFNGGTSSQLPKASYYLLKEVGRNHQLSKVYMEVYYDLMWTNQDYRSATGIYIISDYMKPSLNRLQFIWDTGGRDYIAHGLILGRRNWEKLLDFSYMRENLRKKNTAAYRNYQYLLSDNEDYMGKGFVYSSDYIEKGAFAAKEPFAPIAASAISEENQIYLDKIISYCQEHDIDLIFYSAPLPDFRLTGCGNYDSYIKQMQIFLKDKNVSYYDFNLCRGDILSLDELCYMDDNHLNGKGARLFSAFFADFFSQDTAKEDMFWESYWQKQQHEQNTIFGVICEQHKENDGTISAHITPVGNTDTPVYFTVCKRQINEDEYTEYRPCSEERDFSLPDGETGYFHIYVSLDPEGRQVINDATFLYE